VKLLKMAGNIFQLDVVMFSLHCSSVVQEDTVGETFASSPLREFCTDDRYRHLIEPMLVMMLGE
jgi:hypothetical protein